MGSKAVIGVEEVKSYEKLGKCLLSEFFGTMLLVVVGCGVTITNQPPPVLNIALGFGFIIASMVQCIGHVSGCHINPAVTFGLFLMGRIGMIKAILYIPTQCAGAIAGSAIVKYLAKEEQLIGAVMLGEGVTPGQGFAIEAIITSVLLLVVGAISDPDRTYLKSVAPIAVGLAIICCHIFAIPATGSGMNPARALGPAAIKSIWDNHWVYWIGPLFGAAVAAIVHHLILKAPQKDNSYDL